MATKNLLGCVAGCCLLIGCGGGPASKSTVPQVAPAASGGLEPASDIAVESLLKKPRAELATRAEELEKQIQQRDLLRLAGQQKFKLLPQTRLPLAPPVWRQASFSGERGFSMPPYLPPTGRDHSLALHLARYGDAEAAQQLADPGLSATLDKLKLDRNYPAEWTRLVGLLIHNAQFSLAIDNMEGAKQLVAIHQQLRTLLPEATKQSALGQALLPRGLDTLHQATLAWRKSGRLEVAQQAEASLAKFSGAPAWQWPLPTDRAELTRHLGLSGAGRGAAASMPLRALDLLGLPAPHDHLDACWAFFDDKDHAQSLLLAYRSTQVDYETESQWLPRLDELTKGTPAVSAVLTPGNRYAGGIIEVRMSDARPPTLQRQYGQISLDHTFEHNRRLAAWKQRGASFSVKDAKVLAALRQPLTISPAEASVERDNEQDVPVRVTFSYPSAPKYSLAMVAAPLWERFGVGQVHVDKNIALIWNDAQTRITLSLPINNTQSIVLETSDSSGISAAQRFEAARMRELADRRKRLADKQPFARLPRGLESLTLGMSRADVERMFPGSVNASRRNIPNGVMATYPGQPKSAADAVVRNIIARFDEMGRLAELRVRYADHPSNKPGTLRKRLDALQAAHGRGAVDQLDGAWAADLPVRKGAVEPMHVWNDDITKLTCVLDAGSLEIALLDCPLSHPQGQPLAALTFLTRGPEGFVLGMTRSDLSSKGGTTLEGALLFKTSAASPFDSVLVWCENDKATRIVARYRQDVAKDPAKHLQEAWGLELNVLGWPWRQDLADRVPKAWTTKDAHTRYRLFWQEDNLGTHLLAEWRELQRGS